MTQSTQTPSPKAAPSASPLSRVTAEFMSVAEGRLADRGIDPKQVLGSGEFGESITTAGFYVVLGAVAATEKAGQSPTFAVARLALRAGLPSEIADTLFLAYNQQSAEEAGHGDKVFGNAFFAMGGAAPTDAFSVVATRPGSEGQGPSAFLAPSEDPKENKKRLGSFAGLLGGIETVALQRAFPNIVKLCETWDHPIARDLLVQIRDTVRPEESRHVLLFRYVFHQLIASKGENVIEMFRNATNAGRTQLGAPAIDREEFMRLMGTSAPTRRQLLGKDRETFA